MSEQLEVQEVKKDISGKEVLRLLDEGKSREEIAAHFGQTVAAMKIMVWSHPKLKYRKAKKQFAINLIDDIEEVATETVTQEVIDVNQELEVTDTANLQPDNMSNDVVVGEEEQTHVPANGTW